MKLCSLAIIAVFGLVLLAGCSFLGKSQCGNAACFASAVSSCSDAKYSEDLSGATASYETMGMQGNNCKVTMALKSGTITRTEKTYFVPKGAAISTANVKMDTALSQYAAPCDSDYNCVDGVERCVDKKCELID